VKKMMRLAGSVALAAALATAAAADPVKIGLLVPSPIADVGWARALSDGLDAVKAKYGDEVEIEAVDNIPEGPDADRIMNKMVADGDDIVVLGSFGYMNSGLKLAQRNPDVDFLHASGFKTAENYMPFASKYFEGSYLMGMAAADVTESKKLGVVAAFAIPELIQTINGFVLGARSVDPEITVSVIWVNSWFDPAKEQEAAKALMARGADVLFSNAQDEPAVITAGEEGGAYVVNLNGSMKKYAPSKYLGVVGTDWAPLFLDAVESHLDGTFEGSFQWPGMAEGVIVTGDWSPDISPEMMAKIKETEARIVDGSFNVFAGPIKDQKGEVKVAEGETMPEEAILGMNWQVEGVTTPLPN
jgi:basic membrane protein A